MRNRSIFTILSLCSIVITVLFMHIAGRAHGGVPSGSHRPEFAHAVGSFINPQVDDGSPYYESSNIEHPKDTETPDPDQAQVKAKLDNCQNTWPAHLIWPIFNTVQRREEPMSVHNARHASITLKLIPASNNRRSSWTIAPGLTWKTYTHVGQHWLFADHDRCLFYVTAGDEPLRMVVKSEAG